MPESRTAGQTQEVTEIKPEITPQPLVAPPVEIDRSLFETLEVWGREAFDPDTQDKVKFVNDYLKDNKGLNVISIITELGATPLGTTKLDRVYKYLRLRHQADKISLQGETINKEIENMKQGIKPSWRKNQWG
jgi:hypothetical protein